MRLLRTAVIGLAVIGLAGCTFPAWSDSAEGSSLFAQPEPNVRNLQEPLPAQVPDLQIVVNAFSPNGRATFRSFAEEWFDLDGQPIPELAVPLTPFAAPQQLVPSGSAAPARLSIAVPLDAGRLSRWRTAHPESKAPVTLSCRIQLVGLQGQNEVTLTADAPIQIKSAP
jgi:hypothetical protein